MRNSMSCTVGQGYPSPVGSARMERLAEDVHLIPLAPRHAINAYLLGDVLVDAGVAGSPKRIVPAVRDRGVRAHALTHAHPDHAGGTAAVAAALGVPVWAGERDAPAVEAGRVVVAES